MDSIFEYETIKELVANPPSLNPCPNFFNLRALQTHFTQALKRIPCPQSTVNRWSGAVMSKEMYALIDATPFTPGKKPTTNVPDFPRRFEADGTTVIPYTCEKTINITRKFDREQNYYKTCMNIYRAVYDTLDSHVGDTFKVGPATTPPMIAWNSTKQYF
jgi:hypothetical protein